MERPSRAYRHLSRGEEALIGRGFRACALILSFVAAQCAWAQVGLGTSAPAPAAAPPPTPLPADSLGRDTPRGTVRNFIGAAGQKNSDTAIHYLNTPLRGEAAAALVRQLAVVLNRRLPAKLNEISDRPEGSLSDPKEPGNELIGTIPSDTANVDIVVERIDRDKAGSIWLFSRKTLAEIPELYAEVASVPTGNSFVRYLTDTRIARIALIQWLAVLAGLPLLHLVGIRLNRVLTRTVGQLLRRLGRKPNVEEFEVLPA